jgi:hypothetical protein
MTESRLRGFFLLSPASTVGRRAAVLLSPKADFELARRLRSGEGAPIGEVFSFLSGLYFRGKLAYARRFGSPGRVRIITSDRGLVDPERFVTREDLREMSASDIDASNPNYRTPLARDAAALARRLEAAGRVVLLGSIATGKYADVLGDVFAERLEFPIDFVGRGDMSRGGLMLRAAESGVELSYVPVSGSIRKGVRPPRLPPK